jgi:hypothetical protein
MKKQQTQANWCINIERRRAVRTALPEDSPIEKVSSFMTRIGGL